MPDRWPEAIQQYLQAQYGPLNAQTQLFGLSTNRVWRIQTASATIILKATDRPNEVAFYQHAIPTFNLVNIAPQLYWWHQDQDDIFWLILEDIPHPFPRVRWSADCQQLSMLYQLHQRPFVDSPHLTDLFQPAWDDAMTERALAHFSTDVVADLRWYLDTLRHESQTLFEPCCWISGAPNPTNWGLRDDGALILFDWERFGRGTPALDLAITIPGLGAPAIFEQVAARYLQIRQAASQPQTLDLVTLTREIALAKVWTLVEFLSNVMQGKVADIRGVAPLVEAFPDWLVDMFS